MCDNNLRRVVILLGADKNSTRVDEREGYAQAQAIALSLERLGYESEIIYVNADFIALRNLSVNKPFYIINLVEEIEGQCILAHIVPTMLEAFNLSFSGASSLTYALTTNKIETKKLLKLAGLPTPAWSVNGDDLTGKEKVIIKSVHEDASFGIDEDSVVSASLAQKAILTKKQKLKGQWFAERYIDGREFNVALLFINQTLKVLPIAEIIFVNYPDSKPKIIDYDAKWDEDSFAYKNTAREFLSDKNPFYQQLSELAKKTWHLLGLKDYARIDFRVDSQGQTYILEANANPSLAPDSGFVAAAQHAGIDFDKLISNLLPKKEDYNFYNIIESSDIKALESILQRSGFFSAEEVGVAIEILLEGLNKGPATSYNFIVAKSQTQVLGYACYGRIMNTKDRYDLYWLAVEPELRRQGLGRILLQKVEARIKESLGRRLYVQTSGRKFYEPTRKFYRALGYDETAQLQDYYCSGEDLIIFMKEV